MAEINSKFTFDENQEMQTEPNYLSSEIASPCSSPIPQLLNNAPDTYSAIAQLIPAQHEQMSSPGNFTLHYLPIPSTSLKTDDDNVELFTPKIGNPAQLVPHTPNRHPHPHQLYQQLTPIPDTPESPTPENRGQSDIFRPYDLPESPTTTPYPRPNVSTVTEGLQDMSWHAHIETNAYVTGCLVCGKLYEQVIEEAVADYLHQTAVPRDAVKDRVLKRKAFLDGLQSGIFTCVPRGVSQAAACDGQI